MHMCSLVLMVQCGTFSVLEFKVVPVCRTHWNPRGDEEGDWCACVQQGRTTRTHVSPSC